MANSSVPQKSGIYIIHNTRNGKIYIGQAQNIPERWTKHKLALKGGYHKNRHLQAAWNKYNANTFKLKILEYCAIDQLNEREQHYLDIYVPRGICYNIALDATAPMRGRTHTKEHNRKISEAIKGANHPNFGKPMSEEQRLKLSEAKRGQVPFNKGKTASDEAKRKMSESHKGKKLSSETRYKISEALKGKIVSDETRHKLSVARKGKPLTAEHIQKMSEARKGKVHSEETRKKMSESQKGKTPSAETRRKLSEAATKQHARNRNDREKIDG